MTTFVNIQQLATQLQSVISGYILFKCEQCILLTLKCEHIHSQAQLHLPLAVVRSLLVDRAPSLYSMRVGFRV
jgi:hypothetical protein